MRTGCVGDLDGCDVMLCLVCARRFVCLLVGHPCCVKCVCSASWRLLRFVCELYDARAILKRISVLKQQRLRTGTGRHTHAAHAGEWA